MPRWSGAGWRRRHRPCISLEQRRSFYPCSRFVSPVSGYVYVTADSGRGCPRIYAVSSPSDMSLPLIFGELLVCFLPTLTQHHSEGSTPTLTYIATSYSSSQLLGQLKKELARNGLEGEAKSSNPVNLQSAVDILAEGGMVATLRSRLLLYCHRSS